MLLSLLPVTGTLHACLAALDHSSRWGPQANAATHSITVLSLRSPGRGVGPELRVNIVVLSFLSAAVPHAL